MRRVVPHRSIGRTRWIVAFDVAAERCNVLPADENHFGTSSRAGRDLICAGNGRALNPSRARYKADSNMQKKLPRLRQCKREKGGRR